MRQGNSYRCGPDDRPALDCSPTSRAPARRFQAGISFLESLLALALSMVVSMSAVIVTSNAMGTSSTILHGTQLSNDLRRSMQMISRDVRRAGYTSAAMWCLANLACLPDVTVNLNLGHSLPLLDSYETPGPLVISEDGACLAFELDRDQDGTVTASEHGAYRRRVVAGVGVLEVWMGDTAPDCSSDDVGWELITTPDVVNITAFSVDDSLSIEEVVATDLLGNEVSLRMWRIRLQIDGQLVSNPEVRAQLESVVEVRNDQLL